MIKIAINGFGRIGRAAFRRILNNNSDLKIVGINDLSEIDSLAYLLKRDSVYDTYEKEVKIKEGFFYINNQKIQIFAESNPEKLPWKKLDVDVILECTGRFTDLKGAKKHIKAGAKKVIISANSKDKEIPHFVLGANQEKYDFKKDNIIANCSCTTNCAAPIMRILHKNFEVLKAQMTTIHAVTSTQNLVDGPNKDWRRGRAGFSNIVPTTTGAAKAVIKVIPELKGRISGSAFRVPVICGSILEIIAQIKNETSAEDINKIFIRQAQKGLKGILAVSEEALVSSDIIGTDFSGIIDLCLTEVLELPGVPDENLIKIVAWYDNEWAYACRLVELAEYIGRKL
ncbi:MAG: type I glyceraldehyde-3-phosphate dehydrogenase [Candidatus Pacebacteria bacterium]|nr:type I glyceraldehyde-3-phosphate dehydrogenase [Candidatus Paceibacterota bacterium]